MSKGHMPSVIQSIAKPVYHLFIYIDRPIELIQAHHNIPVITKDAHIYKTREFNIRSDALHT